MKKKILFINPPVIFINYFQLKFYNAAHPTSILKLMRYAGQLGHDIQFIDCMDYEVNSRKPLRFYKNMKAGANGLDLEYKTYINGMPVQWLRESLDKAEPPDEVWISCNITFNNEMAHQCIRAVKDRFPQARLMFGGDYPSLFPKDAARSGAEVYVGHIEAARRLMPDYSNFTGKLNYALFQLTLGCAQNCSHCLNHKLHPSIVRMDIGTVVGMIKECRSRYGVDAFVNMDPSVAPYDLEAFLQAIIDSGLDIMLFFYGGIQVDYVTEKLVTLMKRANVKGLTMPRELDDAMNRRLNKNYSPASFYNAIRVFEKEKFDLSNCHCTIPVCFDGESIDQIRSSVAEIQGMGAFPEVVPVSFVPGTAEYDRHGEKIKGKTLEELNWALWPTLDSIEKITSYSDMYQQAMGEVLHPEWCLDPAETGRGVC